MLLTLLLDSYWEYLKAFLSAYLIGGLLLLCLVILFAFPLLLGVGAKVLLHAEAQRERKRTETSSRAWSTKRATIAVLSFALVIYLLQVFRW